MFVDSGIVAAKGIGAEVLIEDTTTNFDTIEALGSGATVALDARSPIPAPAPLSLPAPFRSSDSSRRDYWWQVQRRLGRYDRGDRRLRRHQFRHVVAASTFKVDSGTRIFFGGASVGSGATVMVLSGATAYLEGTDIVSGTVEAAPATF